MIYKVQTINRGARPKINIRKKHKLAKFIKEKIQPKTNKKENITDIPSKITENIENTCVSFIFFPLLICFPDFFEIN